VILNKEADKTVSRSPPLNYADYNGPAGNVISRSVVWNIGLQLLLVFLHLLQLLS